MTETTLATSNDSIAPSSPDGMTDFQRAAQWSGASWLSDLQRDKLEWLWPNRIPLGRVSLLIGDPGLGKSLLTLDIAARLTRGTPWPDSDPNPQSEIGNPHPDSHPQLSTLNPQPSSVLLLTAEDNLNDTVLPRLETLGADISKVAAFPAVVRHQFRSAALHVPDGDQKLPPMIRTFDLHQDLCRINLMLHAMPDCRLVIVDPISAYLRTTSEQSNAAMRGLLLQLAELARHHNVALLAVNHLRKKDGAAVHRAMGSLAFVAAARAAWVVARDPKSAERRLFMPIKNNLARDVTGLAFTIESDPTSDQPILRWLPDPIDISAETVIGNARPRGRPDAERQDAIDWLRNCLASGPCPAKKVQEEAEAHGIMMRTLRRAFRELRGEAYREDSSPSAQWMWRLPAARRPIFATDGQNSTTDGQISGEEFWPSVLNPPDIVRPTTIEPPGS